MAPEFLEPSGNGSMVTPITAGARVPLPHGG